MNKKSVVFAFGILLGVISTMLLTPIFHKLNFKNKERILWTSSDKKKLESAAYSIIDYNLGIETLAAVFGENRYGPASAESQRIALKVLGECDYYIGGLFALAEATLLGKDRAVRLTAIEMYDENLYKASQRLMANLFIRQLHKETDDEVLSRKLDLLCKHLQMNREMMENLLQQKGIDAVQDTFWDRLQEMSGTIHKSEMD